MVPIDVGTMTILVLIALVIGMIFAAAGGAVGAGIGGFPAWRGAAVPILSVVLPIPILYLLRSPGPIDGLLLQILAAILSGWALKLGLRGTAFSIIGAIVFVGVLVIAVTAWNALIN